MNTIDTAFLIVDVQNDFCPGGALAVPGGDEIVPIINNLSEHFDHVAITQDWHPEHHSSFASSYDGKMAFENVELSYGAQILWPDHCVQGSTGALFHTDLKTDTAELIIRKGFRKSIDSYSAFFENDHATSTGLEGYLKARNIKRLYLAGLATDFCVGYSAIDGAELGLEIFVIEDACRAIDMNGSLNDMLNKFTSRGISLIHSQTILASSK